MFTVISFFSRNLFCLHSSVLSRLCRNISSSLRSNEGNIWWSCRPRHQLSAQISIFLSLHLLGGRRTLQVKCKQQTLRDCLVIQYKANKAWQYPEGTTAVLDIKRSIPTPRAREGDRCSRFKLAETDTTDGSNWIFNLLRVQSSLHATYSVWTCLDREGEYEDGSP